MKAQEIMNTFFVTVRPSQTVQEVASLMTYEGVGIVIVCDAAGVPRGVLTDRDIVTRVCAERLSPEETTVGSVMTPHPLSCCTLDSMEEVEHDMSRRGVGRVLVLDQEGALVGLISLAEIWHHESPLAAGAVSRRLTERQLRVPPTGGHFDSGRAVAPEEIPRSSRPCRPTQSG